MSDKRFVPAMIGAAPAASPTSARVSFTSQRGRFVPPQNDASITGPVNEAYHALKGEPGKPGSVVSMRSQLRSGGIVVVPQWSC
jgi:hypothetical protein